MKRLSILLTFLLGLLSLSACAVPVAPADTEPSTAAEAQSAVAAEEEGDWPETFVVGFFGGDDADDVMENNDPFRVYMEEKLGIPVELFTGTSYTAVIEAMRADRVDAMLVGPFSYVLAVQEAQAEALAVSVGTRAEPPVYDPNAPYHYQSVVFTKKGNNIDSVDDLRGNAFNFVDPASTSGHLAPKTLLIQLGLDPDSEMETVFAGSHPTSVLSVWNDKAPAGATNEGRLFSLRDAGQIDLCWFEDNQIGVRRTLEEIQALYETCEEGQIAILAMADPIPNTPFAIRTEMPDAFKEAVKAALLDTINQPELIEATGRWYVDPSADVGVERLDQFYNSLRDIATLLDLDLHELE